MNTIVKVSFVKLNKMMISDGKVVVELVMMHFFLSIMTGLGWWLIPLRLELMENMKVLQALFHIYHLYKIMWILSKLLQTKYYNSYFFYNIINIIITLKDNCERSRVRFLFPFPRVSYIKCCEFIIHHALYNLILFCVQK